VKKAMKCENAKKFASHRIAKKRGKKLENWSIDRSFAIAFASHYQPWREDTWSEDIQNTAVFTPAVYGNMLRVLPAAALRPSMRSIVAVTVLLLPSEQLETDISLYVRDVTPWLSTTARQGAMQLPAASLGKPNWEWTENVGLFVAANSGRYPCPSVTENRISAKNGYVDWT
jgi:hypothetical protein